jgi:hypothetical protein
MPSTRSINSRQANSTYQSLYLWTSFLLGMISLGIIIWNRRSVIPSNARNLLGNSPIIPADSAVIPAQAGIQENFVIPNAMRNLLQNYLMEIPRFTRDDSLSFASSLVLSTLAYQLSGNSPASFLTLSSWPLFFANSAAQSSGVYKIVPDFQVSNNTAGGNIASVALMTGDWVLVWFGIQPGTYDIYNVYGQRYAVNGSALGAEFQINTNTIGGTSTLEIANFMSGDWLVVWGIEDVEDSSNFSFNAQRYAVDGNKLGSEFQLNINPGGSTQMVLTSLVSGGWVVAWRDYRTGYNIYAKQFTANDTALGTEFRVNSGSAVSYYPVTTGLITGDWVVVWNSGQISQDIFAQHYAGNGSALGSEFRVNSNSSAQQMIPAVASLLSGDWIVVWQEALSGSYNIYVQRYSVNGSTLGLEIQINNNAESYLGPPSIIRLASSDSLIAWVSNQADGSSNLYMRSFADNGSALSNEFQLTFNNSNSLYIGGELTMVSLKSGDWAVMWQVRVADIYSAIFSFTPLLTSTVLSASTTNQLSSTRITQQPFPMTSTANMTKSTESTSPGTKTVPIIAGVAGGGLGLAGCLGVIGFYGYRRKKSHANKANNVAANAVDSGAISLGSDSLNQYESSRSLPAQVMTFSLFSEDAWPQALQQFDQQLPISEENKELQLNRRDKAILLSVVQMNVHSENFLKGLGAVLKQLFAEDIEDWETNVNTLNIKTKVSQGAKELIQFLLQVGFVLRDERAEAYRTLELRPAEESGYKNLPSELVIRNNNNPDAPLANPSYARVDEAKKSEKQYDEPMKLEI